MTAKTGYEAWRERNLSLPLPDEFRIKRDGNPVNGQMNEEAIGQPDYYSRNLTLLNEGALTQTLAHYAWQEKRA